MDDDRKCAYHRFSGNVFESPDLSQLFLMLKALFGGINTMAFGDG